MKIMYASVEAWFANEPDATVYAREKAKQGKHDYVIAYSQKDRMHHVSRLEYPELTEEVQA